MIKKYKQFIIGLICGAIIFGCFPVLGAPAVKNIQVAFNNIKIQVNGQVVQTTDKPFIYNDRTYLPIRPVVESLGATIKLDSENNTVVIDNQASTDIKRPIMTPAPACTPEPSSDIRIGLEYETGKTIICQKESRDGYATIKINGVSYIWLDKILNKFIQNKLSIIYDDEKSKYKLISTIDNTTILEDIPIIGTWLEIPGKNNSSSDFIVSLTGKNLPNHNYELRMDYDFYVSKIKPLLKE